MNETLEYFWYDGLNGHGNNTNNKTNSKYIQNTT